MRRGMTLIELLIVVAIIGVLSSLAVPTFSRMVQKAKKAEAKMLLGAVYKTEATFLAEFGVYGSNLAVMGYEVEGMRRDFNGSGLYAHPGNYSVGFSAVSCVNLAAQPDLPGISQGTKDVISQNVPDFYIASVDNNSKSGSIFCPQKVFSVCILPRTVPASVGVDGQTYVAGAGGVISPNYNICAPNPNDLDQWTINENRVLSNIVDGTR